MRSSLCRRAVLVGLAALAPIAALADTWPTKPVKIVVPYALRGPAGESTTNIAFGGPDRKWVYCTNSTSGTILRAAMDVAGMPLHRRQA